MVNNLTNATSIFESLGILSSFNIAETIWESYENFATSKIKESTIKLRGSIFYLKDLKPNEALNELNAIKPLIPILVELRKTIEHIDDINIKEFRNIAKNFFETVDYLFHNLQDIADVNSSYEFSKPVLAKDWDSIANQHWDNY